MAIEVESTPLELKDEQIGVGTTTVVVRHKMCGILDVHAKFFNCGDVVEDGHLTTTKSV